ncbi:alpha-amylase [bacterium]|nr:alpha-amylase [bacterium]
MPHILYEINAHVWLREQPWAREGGTLADVPDSQIREWADMGIDTIWLLGVWTKGQATARICRETPDIRRQLEKVVPGIREEEIIGSPFSIAEYSLSPTLGNKDALQVLRRKLNDHGLRLMLDFVPNHVAVDHPWVAEHPEYFISGTDVELERHGGDYFRVPERPETVLAHGRDPYFSGWTDTAQINYFSREARQAMTDLLLGVSDACDGVRCDMAMLIANEVFKRTWGDLSLIQYPDGRLPEFWTETIAAVKRRHPGFFFLGEVYWGMERKLQEMGFDYTYDKTLYDLAREHDGSGIRRHLHDTRDMQDRMARFIENHDEGRAAEVFGSRHRALATLISILPGLRILHQGQMSSRRAHLPVQVAVRPDEPRDGSMWGFYDVLLNLTRQPVMREGVFRSLFVSQVWEDNPSARFIVTASRCLEQEVRLAVVNLADEPAQAYTEIPEESLGAGVIEFRDLLSDRVYYRDGANLRRSGLFLDLPPGGYHLFDVGPAPEGAVADA